MKSTELGEHARAELDAGQTSYITGQNCQHFSFLSHLGNVCCLAIWDGMGYDCAGSARESKW